MANHKKPTVPGINVKKNTKAKGSSFTIGFKTDEFIEHLLANTSPTGWCNIELLERLHPSEKGHTHIAVHGNGV